MEQELSTKANKIAVISLSGGIDSTSLLLKLLTKKYKIYALSFDYGQKHKIEICKAKLNIDYLNKKDAKIDFKIIDISDCVNVLNSSLTNKNINIPNGHYEESSMLSTVVPNRNAIFSSILFGYGLSISKKYKNKDIELCLGVHSGDHAIYPDCRHEFYEHIIESFHIGNWNSKNIKLNLPYLNMNKKNIIKDAIKSIKKLNLNFNTIFKNTITSYNPNSNGISNGKTGSDIERILAFDSIGIKDPLKYKYSWNDVVKHAKKTEKEYKKRINL